MLSSNPGSFLTVAILYRFKICLDMLEEVQAHDLDTLVNLTVSS